ARPEPLAGLGIPLPDPRIRHDRTTRTPRPDKHPRDTDPPAVQRPHRIHQHQNPATDPQRLRLQETRSTHRPGPTRPRRTQTHPPHPLTTHGTFTRAFLHGVRRL